jgi:gentisate 1,2-dioxygenase
MKLHLHIAMLHSPCASSLKARVVSQQSKARKLAWSGILNPNMSDSRGDVILTPSWHWHDHGHEGSGPMIWLDGLDLPMFQAIPVNFAQGYKERRYPSMPFPESMHKFPWGTVVAALAAVPGSYARYQYYLSGGRQLSAVIGAEAERVDAGTSGPSRQETSSFVYHIVEGEGYTEIDGKRFQWTRCDTFCVPAWKQHRHYNTSDETVYLFSFSDRPLLEKLGMFRRQEEIKVINGTS